MYTIVVGKPCWYMFCAVVLVTMLSQSGPCSGSSQQAESAKKSNAASVNSRMNTNREILTRRGWRSCSPGYETGRWGSRVRLRHGDLTEEQNRMLMATSTLLELSRAKVARRDRMKSPMAERYDTLDGLSKLMTFKLPSRTQTRKRGTLSH
jgi:hypothetical protein